MAHVAVIGAGPTGVYALARLIRSAPLEVTLFETSARPGPGTPYDEAVNAPEWLANIASYELPPVVDRLADWLARLPAPARARLSVSGPVGAREFYPRIALGAYFVAQLRKLVRRGGERGHVIEVRSGSRVADVAGLPEGVRVSYFDARGRLGEARFDYVLIATGHRARAVKPARHTVPAYPAPRLREARDIAVLGASLSAIDAALALALQRGAFREGVYVPEAPLRIELLSRRGVLPETDFYFPFPYEPLRHCTAPLLRSIGLDAAPRKLDRAFASLARELEHEDPGFARRLRLKTLDADSFADAYFTPRTSGDPFEHLRRNLSDTQADSARRRTSRWRYAILRAHEAFAELTPHLDAADLARFRRGLGRVFADNYAAVPPQSARRLLALRDAGALSLRRVGAYELKPAPSGGTRLVEPGAVRDYDLVVDARGERHASTKDLPFPTLRLQALANRLHRRDGEPLLAVNAALRLGAGVNPVDRIYCLAAPFLLGRRPFVQGLVSAHDLATRAVEDLLSRRDEANVALHGWRDAELILGADFVVAAPSGLPLYRPVGM